MSVRATGHTTKEGRRVPNPSECCVLFKSCRQDCGTLRPDIVTAQPTVGTVSSPFAEGICEKHLLKIQKGGVDFEHRSECLPPLRPQFVVKQAAQWNLDSMSIDCCKRRFLHAPRTDPRTSHW